MRVGGITAGAITFFSRHRTLYTMHWYPDYNVSVIGIALFAAVPIVLCLGLNNMTFLTNAVQGLIDLLTLALLHKMTKVEKSQLPTTKVVGLRQ